MMIRKFRAHWALLMLVFGALPVAADDAKIAPRAVSFQIAVECNCASCVFDTQRSLKKFEGVKSAKFNGRDHRLELEFIEGAKTISDLTITVEKSDLGKGSALCWSVPRGGDAKAQAANLEKVPGVKSAKPDYKTGLILLSFQAKPVVTLKQLDAASPGDVNVHQ